MNSIQLILIINITFNVFCYRSSVRDLLLVLVFIAGCAPEPALVLGTGAIDFEDVEAGASLPIIQGPQGGFHLLASFLVVGVQAGDRQNLGDESNPSITLDVEHEGNSIILISPFVQGLEEAPLSLRPWTHQLIGRFAILDIAVDDALDGETVTMSARVDDVHGVTVSDSVYVDLFPHPDNGSEF